MTTNRTRFWKHCATVLLFVSVSCALAQTPASNDGPATRELRRLVAADPDFKHLLVASIERARQVNPDLSTNPAQSLEQYYEFISWAERALPGDLLKQKPDATLYQRLDQSLGYLYYICDQPLDELKGRGFFNNSLQYVEPFASWNRSFVRSWGAFLNSPESWNEGYLRLARADTTFGLDRGWYEDPFGLEDIQPVLRSQAQIGVAAAYRGAHRQLRPRIPCRCRSSRLVAHRQCVAGDRREGNRSKDRNRPIRGATDRGPEQVQACVRRRDVHSPVSRCRRLSPLPLSFERRRTGGNGHPGKRGRRRLCNLGRRESQICVRSFVHRLAVARNPRLVDPGYRGIWLGGADTDWNVAGELREFRPRAEGRGCASAKETGWGTFFSEARTS